MADGYIAIDEPTAVDKKLDTTELTVGANTVQRERVQIAGSSASEIAPVSGTDGLLVNLGSNNDVTVTGTVTNTPSGDHTVVGKAAADAPVSGNPLLLGARASAAAPTDVSADGDAVSLWATLKGALNVADGGGTLSVDDGGGSLTIDASSLPLPTGAATAAKQDTIIGHLDGVEGLLTTIDADTGALAGAVSGTEVQVDIVAALPAGTNNIGDVDIVTMPGVVGTVADDATTPGAPVMIGGVAKSPDGTDPGNVSAEDDVARVITDLNRRLLVSTEHPRSGHVNKNGSTAYTDESLVSAPGSGYQIIITNIIMSTGAGTALNFFLEEGATKIFGPVYLEAVAGRGFNSGPIRLPVTANTAVTLTTSASIAQAFDMDYYIQKV